MQIRECEFGASKLCGMHKRFESTQRSGNRDYYSIFLLANSSAKIFLPVIILIIVILTLIVILRFNCSVSRYFSLSRKLIFAKGIVRRK